MPIIIYTELITILTLLTIVKYQSLFSNLFWLVTSAVIIAFIPNFITTLLYNSHSISPSESSICYSVTGGIVLSFLWKILSKYKLEE